jgi:PAS domain-containing protein
LSTEGDVSLPAGGPPAKSPSKPSPGSDQQFRTLVESVFGYAIFMLDPHGYVTTWNAGAQRLKGLCAE